MLTLHQDCLADALEAGATGYLLEDIKSEDLTRAIRKVHQQEIIIDQRFATMPEVPDWITDYLFSGSNSFAAWVRDVDLLISPSVGAARLIILINRVEEVLGANICRRLVPGVKALPLP